MLSVWRSAFRNTPGSDVILAFIQSWGMHGVDETSISSGTLDIMRAYLGDRPCCVWKKVPTGLSRISERGMVEVLYGQGTEGHERALAKAAVSGVPEFDACPVNVNSDFEGYLHIPI